MATDIHSIIASRRTALPSHELAGVPFRRWAATVCTAEVKHARDDVAAVTARLGADMLYSEHRDTAWVDGYFLPHETKAAVALNWLSHVQAHESDARGPWERLSTAGPEYRARWLARYRYLLKGFIRAAKAYRAARGSLA